MRSYSYFWDVLNLNMAFVAAFDDAFVFRYDAVTRQAKEKINVRYVFGPKHRVMHDITDGAKTLTLPVVTIEQLSLRRDPTRVSHKGKFFNLPGRDDKLSKIPTPIPISMELEVGIIAYYKEDIDQIVQNFVVNCDPYIIVSTKIPEEFGVLDIQELRPEIQWSGDVTYENPKNLDPSMKWRVTATTSFTVKGWMFKSHDTRQAPIYKVQVDFHDTSLNAKIHDMNYDLLSGQSKDVDTVTVSAYPTFSNVFYSNGNNRIEIFNDLIINKDYDNGFLLYGKMLDRTNSFYLSSGEPNFYTNFELVSTAKSPLISAYRLPGELVDVQSDNIVTIDIPRGTLPETGKFTIITSNEAAWTSLPNGMTIQNL